MTFQQACEEARKESKETGCVQHVNATLLVGENGARVKEDGYYVSDWLDSSTVATFVNGVKR